MSDVPDPDDAAEAQIQLALGSYRRWIYLLATTAQLALQWGVIASRPAEKQSAFEVLLFLPVLGLSVYGWIVPATVIRRDGFKQQRTFRPWSDVVSVASAGPGDRYHVYLTLVDGERRPLLAVPEDRLPGIWLLARRGA